MKETSSQLNLNLEFKCTIDNNENTNLEQKLIDSLNFSSQSRAIISLVEYCQLKSGEDFKTVCYYSKSEILNKINASCAEFKQEFTKFLIDTLSNKYNQVHFTELNEGFELNKFNIRLCDLDLIDSTDLIFDTVLPSLSREISDTSNITITGLASLYRDIIKTACLLKPSLKLGDLLVIIQSYYCL